VSVQQARSDELQPSWKLPPFATTFHLPPSLPSLYSNEANCATNNNFSYNPSPSQFCPQTLHTLERSFITSITPPQSNLSCYSGTKPHSTTN